MGLTPAGYGKSPIRFLGVDFAAMAPGEVLDWVMAASAQDRFHYVVTPNVDHIVMLHEPVD